MMTVAEIQAAYPAPVKFQYGLDADAYCVAGAAIKYSKITLPYSPGPYEYAFPGTAHVIAMLIYANPALAYATEEEYAVVYTLATAILSENDNECFACAWMLLDEALTYHR
jgi:hypothetical protein